MLYTYPIEATAENWLHDCLIMMLRAIHSSIRSGSPQQDWLTIIQDKYRKSLRKCTGLPNRLQSYCVAFTKLNEGERQKVESAMVAQNDIPALLSCSRNCCVSEDLPVRIREPLKALFKYAYEELLTYTGTRDRFYATIYRATQSHICPFCGCEYFDAPGAPRESLDHYLAKDKYPFAAVNL